MTENMSLPPYPDDKNRCIKCGTIEAVSWFDTFDAVTGWYCRGGKCRRYWLFGEMINECSDDITGEHMHFECSYCGADYHTRTMDHGSPIRDKRLEETEKARDEAISLLRGLLLHNAGTVWTCAACNNLIDNRQGAGSCSWLAG